MENSLGLILGLTGAVCWGIADFAARFASRRVGAYRTLFFMQFFGFVVLSVYLRFEAVFCTLPPGWQPWALHGCRRIVERNGFTLALSFVRDWSDEYRRASFVQLSGAYSGALARERRAD